MTKEEEISSKQLINAFYYGSIFLMGFVILLKGHIILSAIWYMGFILVEIITRLYQIRYKTEYDDVCILK